MKMRTALYSMMLIACVAVVPSASGQQGQRPVWQQKSDYLMNGPAGYSARAAGQRMHQAREYSQHLYEYARPAPAQSIPIVVTKVEAEHIGQTLHAAAQNLAVVKKDAEKTNDKAILKKLELIDAHLAKATEHHKMMNIECCKDKVDGEAVAGRCDDLITELDKAIAEHASLIRLLGGKAAATVPAKEAK
jgi:hypothetical protein